MRRRGCDRQVVHLDAPWISLVKLAFTLRMDGLAWMFALLVAGIGSSWRSGGLAVLACIVTATPGTSWARYDG